jgi:hypothetical protein
VVRSPRQAPLSATSISAMNVRALTVETRRRAHAACIARALGAPISRTSTAWLVTFEIDVSNDLGRLLQALQSCLNDAAIPMVTVALDDVRYLMEAERPTRRKQTSPA